MIDAARERARERNQGHEPDELHIAYEVELARLRLENDAARVVLYAFRRSLRKGNRWERGEVAARLHDFDDLVRRMRP